MRRSFLLLAFALAACSHAPQPLQPLAPAALAARAAADTAMRQPMRSLMDRCFTIMTHDYGTTSVDADALAHYTGLPADQAAADLKAMDTNGDGKVSRAELVAWGQRPGGLAAMRDAVINPAFRAADADGDGALAPTEAEAATLALADQRWPLAITAADVKAADRDGDGRLSLAEFAPLAAAKLHGGLATSDDKLPRGLASIVFKAIPWSH